jgi:hypothetical protein
MTLDIGPPEMPTRSLLGLAPKGVYEWSLWAPPSSWLHRRELTDRVGPWRDGRALLMPTDMDLLNRAYEHGCVIVPVDELTVFKFTSVTRTNAYRERRCDEQAAWWDRLCREPDLRYRELVEALKNLGGLGIGRIPRAARPAAASRSRRGGVRDSRAVCRPCHPQISQCRERHRAGLCYPCPA